MAAYTINYSDGLRTISISTGTIDYTTSLGLVGPNTPNFGTTIAENFLHLLENFASSTNPTNSTPGQLWYDITDSENKVLRINDGTGLSPQSREVGSVIRSDSQPDTARIGDIWVDTTNNLLYIYNNASSDPWILVGPSFTSTFRTGAYPEQILGTDAQQHLIIKNYLNGDVLTLVAQETFTPSLVIEGFSSLVPGVNLSTKLFGGAAPTFNGLATQAAALKVTVPSSQVVPANSFFRKDIPQSLSQVLTINNNSGINIGQTTATFQLTKQSRDAVITNTADRANMFFNLYKNSAPNTILTLSGDSERVGINQVNPNAALDVTGNANISGNLVIGGNTSTYKLDVTGTARVTGNAVLSGTVSIAGTSTFSGNIVANSLIRAGTTGTIDIGQQTVPFNRIWVNFIGTGTTRLLGTSAAADRFTGTPKISIGTGTNKQISADPIVFNGTQDQIYLNAVLTNNAIDAQTSFPTGDAFIPTPSSYTLAISNGTSQLYKITKAKLLDDVTPNLIKPGFIMASAFTSVASGAILGAPPGWLWCDGAPYSTSGATSALYTALMQSLATGATPPYGSTGAGSFNVPNIPDIVASNSEVGTRIRYMIKL
jgi:hypothetical protein